MDKATQRGKILGYCAEHGSITIREAFEKLHINSPTKRISELKKAGHDIRTVIETRVKDDGETVRYKRYFINAQKDLDAKICVGQEVSFIPAWVSDGNYSPEERQEVTVTGKIASINWEHRHFLVEYSCGSVTERESFHFRDVGQAVKVCG